MAQSALVLSRFPEFRELPTVQQFTRLLQERNIPLSGEQLRELQRSDESVLQIYLKNVQSEPPPIPHPEILLRDSTSKLWPILQSLFLSPVLLESPFAWKKERVLLTEEVSPRTTISFTATRISKVFGYIPLIGTVMGIFRIYDGCCEYELFTGKHLHALSKRSVLWIVRGVLESIPLLGGIICIITDIVATCLSKCAPDRPVILKENSPCGVCHQCGLCEC